MNTTDTLKLTRKQHHVGNVWFFEFQPSQSLSWIPGQFMQIELPHDHPDQEGTKRYFTIASAPHEQSLRIATRLTKSSFKQALIRLPVGGKLSLLSSPAGNFIWQTSAQPLVFVAQGIGITPFYSMLKSRHHHQQPLTATLVYANLDHIVPFKNEIADWANNHLEFNAHFLTQATTAPKLQQLIPNLSISTVYASGPKPLTTLLIPPFSLPASQLKTDLFPNYSAAAY